MRGRGGLDREVDAVLGAVREEVRVDLVVGYDVILVDVGAVEHPSRLLHVRDGERVRVNPLTDLKRAVGAEFEVDTSGARLTVRTSHEGPRFFRQVRKALLVRLLTLIDANCENRATTEFGGGQLPLVLDDVLVAVDTDGRLSVCGCVGAAISLQRGKESRHNFDALRIISVKTRTESTRPYGIWHRLATAGVRLPLG